MKKIILLLVALLFISGCSIVRIETNNIDNVLNIILTKNNKLYNQIGQGYKYYLPGGVTYIDSDGLNDVLYCDGVYYYLFIDTISYYYKTDINYKENSDAYYSRKLTKKDGFKYSGFLEINEKDDMYYIEFVYNHAKIETVVDKDHLNRTVLNASYILSTIKYNHNIVELMLKDDYFTNKTGKYNNYNTEKNSEKFVIEKEEIDEEGK